MAERQPVNNPFSLGPAPGRSAYNPDLANRARPLGQYQTFESRGQMAVEALVNFAGVAGSEYVKGVQKKLEADKAVQTSRAVQGLAPTDEATVAGYQAHAAVSIKNQTLSAQARLNALAQQRNTDDEWEEAIREEYRNLDEFMGSNYKTYSNDIALQKLASVALRDVIPQVTSTREASKVGFEIEDRMNIASDTIVNAVNSNPSARDPKILLNSVDDMLGSLKLTESQKDSAIVKAIQNSRDPALIELSKLYKGKRSTSLYDRTGSIQKIDRMNFDESVSQFSVELEEEKMMLESQLINKELTVDEFTKIWEKRNKDLKGRFGSGPQYRAAIARYDKASGAEFSNRRAIEIMSDTTLTDASTLKSKEIQGALVSIFSNEMQRYERQATDAGLVGQEREKFLTDKRKSTIHRVGDMTLSKGQVFDPWVGSLNNLANLNIPANVLDAEVGAFKVEQLPPHAQTAIEILDNLSVPARDEFIEALGAREGRTLRMFMNLRDMDMPLPQALDQAQRTARNPSPVDTKAVNKAIEEVRSNQEFFWWRDDFKSAQEKYLEQEIRNKVMLDPMPDSDRNVEVVSSWMDRKWTTVGDGLRLKGSPSELQRQTGLHVDKLGNAMEGVVNLQSDLILPQLEGLGLNIGDVFPVTDTKLGTVRLVTSTGHWLGKPIAMSEVRSYANRWKVEQEKRASKQWERLSRQIWAGE